MKKDPIAVICPMMAETEKLLSLVTVNKTENFGIYQFVECGIDGFPVVLVRTNIGVANAAAATVLCIDRYHPACFIVQGTSGAHEAAMQVGDIVLGESIINMNAFNAPFRGKGEGSHPETWDYYGMYVADGTIDSDGAATFLNTLHSDPALLGIAEQVPYSYGNVLRGTITSGDGWNRERDRIDFFHDRFGSKCEEMENFAVAQIARGFEIPCLGIRVISNNELDPNAEYDVHTAEYCQEFTYDVIRAIIKEWTEKMAEERHENG